MKNASHFRKNDPKAARFSLRRKALWIATTAGWLFAPRYVSNYLRNQFFTPAKYPLNGKQMELESRAEKFSLQVNGKRIQGWKWGSGSSVLLVHGWGGSGFQFSEFVDPLVQTGHTAITWDHPGHGFSEGKITNFLEIVKTFWSVVEMFPDPKAIIGHSMGAGVSLNIPPINREGFKFVFISPNYELKEELLKYLDHIGINRKIFIEALHQVERENHLNFDDLTPDVTAPKTGSPALIFHDDNDRVTPFSQSVMLAEHMKKARVVKTYGLGHGKILFDRAVVEEAIRYLSNDTV